ncbi:MAG: hypothetical protein ACREPY_16950 [Rhodanobacteraceae bacterium]
MAAFVEMAPGDALVIGKSIIKLERKGGQRARLAIESSENFEHIRADDKPAHPADGHPPATILRRPSPA